MAKKFSDWLTPVAAVFLAMVVAVALSVGIVIGSHAKKAETAQANATEAKSDIEQFSALLDKLTQEGSPKQERAAVAVMEKLARVVEKEAKNNPQAMSSHIEEMIRLVPMAGPGVAIQFEGYASAAVREEMKRLREDANVAKLIKLESELTKVNQEIKEVREKEKLFAKKVPVFLQGWNSAVAIFKVTNTLSKETKTYSVPAGPTPEMASAVAFLEPGEYTVEFYLFRSPSEEDLMGKSTFLVSPHQCVEMDGKGYHASVRVPGILKNP